MSKQLDKAVTTRFSMEDYLSLQQEAERRGCAIADIIRKSWTHFQQQQQLHQHLLKLEQRQRKVTFEMLCSVVGLQANERQQAIEQLQQQGVKW